jgi:glycosyltransferase involved in cell wall biosynthesis
MDKLSCGLSIVIPECNSAESLPLLGGRLKPVLETLGRPFEVILINNGSRDRSWDTVQSTARNASGWCRIRRRKSRN